jgi:predicted alpha/beta superfamily hydrolase
VSGTKSRYLIPKERIEQTYKTIASLKEHGIQNIYLADNSGKEHEHKITELFPDIILLL